MCCNLDAVLYFKTKGETNTQKEMFINMISQFFFFSVVVEAAVAVEADPGQSRVKEYKCFLSSIAISIRPKYHHWRYQMHVTINMC